MSADDPWAFDAGPRAEAGTEPDPADAPFRPAGRRQQQLAAEADRAQDTGRHPEPVAVTWAHAQLRDRIQRSGTALAGAAPPAGRRMREADSSPLAEMEAEP